jgi:hypothetical protein
MIGALLLMRRRWRLPFGAIMVMFTWPALLWPLLSKYEEWKLAPALILTGLVADLLFARFDRAPGPPPVGRIRAIAAALPPILWGLFFICVALFEGGLGWHATLWVGVLVTSAGLGYALSLAIFPPFTGPVVEEVPDEAPATAVAETQEVAV